MGRNRLSILDWRLAASAVFVLLAAGVLLLQALPAPLGPGTVIYEHYWPFWVLVLAATTTMLVSIRLFSMPWPVVVTYVLAFALAGIALSYVWGYPYGIHDPWRHLGFIETVPFAPTAVAYPVFHVLVAVLSNVTGARTITVLMRMTALSALAGGVFLSMLVRRLPGDGTARQTAAVVGTPALFATAVPRPFSLAIPFVLLVYWLSLSRLGGVSIGREKRLLLIVFLVLPFFHPLVAVIAIVIGAVSWAAYEGGGRLDGWPSVRHDLRRIRGMGLLGSAVVGIVLTYHLLTTSIGVRIIASTASVGQGAAEAGGSEIIRSATSGWGKFVETVQRFSYVILLGLATLLTIGSALRRRFRSPKIATGLVAGSIVAGMFLGIAFFVPVGVGLFRVIVVAPFVAVPTVVYGLQSAGLVDGFAVTVLAILIVTAGTVTAYESSLVGGVAESANEGQVEAVNWIVAHHPQQVVGTSMTFWIMEGLYGEPITAELSAKPAPGTWITSARNASYSWGTTGRSPSALYVVDSEERQRARQAASEGATQPLDCLRRFRVRQDKVYDNPDTRIFTRNVVLRGCGSQI